MTPYTNFYYFGFALYALLPVFLFFKFKLASKFWLVITTIFMLALQYAATKNIFVATNSEAAFAELALNKAKHIAILRNLSS